MEFINSIGSEPNGEKKILEPTTYYRQFCSSIALITLFTLFQPNLAQPQMLVVGDVQEMFMPLLDGFLADVDQSEALIDMLMEQIPTMFGETRETETVLAPAIQAGLEALKVSDTLALFH